MESLRGRLIQRPVREMNPSGTIAGSSTSRLGTSGGGVESRRDGGCGARWSCGLPGADASGWGVIGEGGRDWGRGGLVSAGEGERTGECRGDWIEGVGWVGGEGGGRVAAGWVGLVLGVGSGKGSGVGGMHGG